MSKFSALIGLFFCWMLLLTFACSTSHNVQERYDTPRAVKLTKNNTILLRGEINEQSMYLVSMATLYLNQQLPPGVPIYLVLDTNGGYVTYFERYIQLSRALNGREIKTITIKSYSAGAFLVQNLGERLTTLNGSMMFHEMSMDYPRMQMRKHILPQVGADLVFIESIEAPIARRLNLTLNEYKKAIEGDWYIDGGFNMIKSHVADRVVLLKCDEAVKAEIPECLALPTTNQ